MSDTDQGSLFREAVEAPTLAQFENAPLPESKPEAEPTPEPKPKPEAEAPPHEPEAAVPSGRFREESERRRQAERERDDLRAQLAAWQVQRTQTAAPGAMPKPLDVFDNPAGFVRQEVEPLFNQFRQELQMTREAMSADNAVRVYGEEKVTTARNFLEQGMARHDPNAWATYQRAMSSHDPYGVITRWHMDRETLTQIGGDLESYKQRILQDAMKDPDFQRQFMQAVKANGASVNRPAPTQPKAPTLPSLSDIGAAGADEGKSEPSDTDLFRAVVSAKRR